VPSRARRRHWMLPASLSLSVVALVGLALPSAAAPSNSAQAVVAATRATNRALKGTNRAVDPTPRPAVPGKHVVVISAGQASISAQVGVDAAVDAAKAIGWQVEVYDAKLNPANYAPLVRQAIAAKVDGIILGAIDCQAVEAPLREARAANIAVIGGGAFDCNDPHGGNAKQGLFSAQINYGPRVKSLGSFAEAYGADQANYIVSKSRNRAKILVLNDPEFTTLYYTNRGFENVIDKSHGSKIVSTLEITTADFTGTSLVSKIQAELLRHPEVTWIKSPFTYATTLGIVPALGSNDRKIDVMGGEGFEPELDLIRAGKITAVNIFLSEWVAWAGVDTMNSVFRKERPADSGVGWVLADKAHNTPPSGDFRPPIDFRAQYRKAWGVSG
jgi:ribose transport system substrate-binding protein